MKLLLLCLAFAAVGAQFGNNNGFFGNNNNGGGNCDYRALMQAVQQKERCYKELLDIKKEAMQAIQQRDPTCNKGMFDSWQKCDPLFEPWLEQNDLSGQAVMECCFGSRVGSSSRRQCEFKNKPMPDGMGKKKGGKGKKGSGSGMKGRGGPRGMMDPMEMEMEQRFKAEQTLAGCALESLGEVLEMGEHVSWCMEEDRPVEMSALQGPYRTYKDKFIAKAWECYTPMMQVATNCTDVQFEDIECIGKGIAWAGLFKMDCILSCHPDSLSSFCNFFTSLQQGGGNNNNRFNNQFSNSNNNRFNTNAPNNNRNNNNQNNNNNGFFDPFGY